MSSIAAKTKNTDLEQIFEPVKTDVAQMNGTTSIGADKMITFIVRTYHPTQVVEAFEALKEKGITLAVQQRKAEDKAAKTKGSNILGKNVTRAKAKKRALKLLEQSVIELKETIDGKKTAHSLDSFLERYGL